MTRKHVPVFIVALLLFHMLIPSTKYAQGVTDGLAPREELHWQWLSHQVSGHYLLDVTFGAGLFVAVGEAGTILTSDDGETWVVRRTDQPDRLFYVTYGNGRFVTLGTHPTQGAFVLVSEDGFHWVHYAFPATWRSDIRGLQFAEGTFFAMFLGVGIPDYLFSSVDGIRWTRQEVPKEVSLHSVAYGAGRYLAAGRGNYMQTHRNLPQGPWATAKEVRASPHFFTSTDGLNWQTLDPVVWNEVNRIAYLNGHFYLAFWGGLISSPDGLNWTLLFGHQSDLLLDIVWTGRRYVASGFDVDTRRSYVRVSDDGVNWTYHPLGDDEWTFERMAAGHGKVVAIHHERIYLSVDGIHWQDRNGSTLPFLSDEFVIRGGLLDIAWGSGTYVAVGGYPQRRTDWYTALDGFALVSTDGGRSWSQHAMGLAERVMWDGSRFVAWKKTGQRNEVQVSPDGRNWSPASDSLVSAGNANRDVATGEGWHVAVTDNGDYLTSRDGTNWIDQRAGEPHRLYGVTYANGSFVAVGKNMVRITGKPCHLRAAGVPTAVAAFAVGCYQYAANGETRQLDAAPLVNGGRTFLPVRYLAYSLGISPEGVRWDAATETVTLTKGDTTVSVQLGSQILKRNGATTAMDVTPQRVPPGRVMLPARFVAEAFGFGVQWDQSTQTVLVGPGTGTPALSAPADTTPPVWSPGSRVTSTFSGSTVRLSWPVADDRSGVHFYRVYRGEDKTASDFVTIPTYEEWGEAGKTVQFRIEAVDIFGNVSAPLLVEVRMAP